MFSFDHEDGFHFMDHKWAMTHSERVEDDDPEVLELKAELGSIGVGTKTVYRRSRH